MPEEDTDLLLALLKSLLHPATYPEDALLRVLVECDGSPEAAAERLLGEIGETSSSLPIKQGEKKKRQQTQTTLKNFAQPPPAKRAASATTSRSEATAVDASASAACSKPETSKASKPVFDLAMLKDVSSTEKSKTVAPRASLSTLVLATDALLAKHLPCIIAPPSPLSPELATALFYAMHAESRTFQKLKWNINAREVESPHTTAFYVSESKGPDYTPEQMTEAASYWYNGRVVDAPRTFPPLLQRVADLIEPVVNAELRRRRRFKGEWTGDWKATVAAVNLYEGADSGVGPHSDQLTYLGPWPTIASLTLGTSRMFRLRQVPAKDPAQRESEGEIRNYDVPMNHNTLLIMLPPSQEQYKHSVPAVKAINLFRPAWDEERRPVPREQRQGYRCRIGITFRFYHPDFSPARTPLCHCKLPCVLKADQKHLVKSSTVDPESSHAHYWLCNIKTASVAPPNEHTPREGCSFFQLLQETM